MNYVPRGADNRRVVYGDLSFFIPLLQESRHRYLINAFSIKALSYLFVIEGLRIQLIYR